MTDREIEAFLRGPFGLENCRFLHSELKKLSRLEKGPLICRLLLLQSASNMKNGYFATAGPLESSKRHRLVGTIVTIEAGLKLIAIDTSQSKKLKEMYQSTGPSDDGIGKYLDDMVKVIWMKIPWEIKILEQWELIYEKSAQRRLVPSLSKTIEVQ